MSCSSPECPGGNCPGCIDGKVWCQDPRCAPYCRDCAPPPDNNFAVNVTMAIIIIALIIILFIVWFAYGPAVFVFHNDPSRASTQNKNLSTLAPPPQYLY